MIFTFLIFLGIPAFIVGFFSAEGKRDKQPSKIFVNIGWCSLLITMLLFLVVSIRASFMLSGDFTGIFQSYLQ